MAAWQNGLALQYVHDEFKKELDLVLTAVRTTPEAVVHAHPDLLANTDALAEIAECNGGALWFLPDEYAKQPVVSAAHDRWASRPPIQNESLAGLKGLMSIGKDAGYATIAQIEQHMPAFPIALHELEWLADSLDYECSIDVFAKEPTEEERHTTRNGIRQKALREYLRAGAGAGAGAEAGGGAK